MYMCIYIYIYILVVVTTVTITSNKQILFIVHIHFTHDNQQSGKSHNIKRTEHVLNNSHTSAGAGGTQPPFVVRGLGRTRELANICFRAARRVTRR